MHNISFYFLFYFNHKLIFEEELWPCSINSLFHHDSFMEAKRNWIDLWVFANFVYSDRNWMYKVVYIVFFILYAGSADVKSSQLCISINIFVYIGVWDPRLPLICFYSFLFLKLNPVKNELASRLEFLETSPLSEIKYSFYSLMNK
jgi:hypothetical protein